MENLKEGPRRRGTRKNWQEHTRGPCKLKTRNRDSSAYCVYCRKNRGSCTYENCPLVEEETS